ncbi:hypothetical protein [Kitasatospora cheerisanensis]|uniref:Uncharacterized protein n=1 Tax=Kitasatospora cheerisanensis KCTC 2395 TaxID=1348663 RepID=A0A066YI24_9ACTN|nr:hypothetical protein [Kitasatospora cheerisanensis]KDN81138.1 hypothetical protein KCH_72320 [Kitasatospora cheerisanensis KCTC 2395]
MTKIEAIEAVLTANSRGGHRGWSGEFAAAGQLASRGEVALCGLDGAEFYTYGALGDGLHEVYLAYEQDDERGATVTAVALLAGGCTPQALTAARWEQVSDDVNELSERATALHSGTPERYGIRKALHLTPEFASGEDPIAQAVAELRAQQEAGSRTPVLDVLVDPATGANALVFPTWAFTSNSILIGRDAAGAGVGILWSHFGE